MQIDHVAVGGFAFDAGDRRVEHPGMPAEKGLRFSRFQNYLSNRYAGGDFARRRGQERKLLQWRRMRSTCGGAIGLSRWLNEKLKGRPATQRLHGAVLLERQL